MKPSRTTVQKEIKKLRNLIDTTDDRVVARIAYAIESALIWVTTDTKEIYTPTKDAISNAGILREEIAEEEHE